jgi:nucleotide-binding universal stress UspA family protein
MTEQRLVSPIVVGVSRRTGSPDALRWATAEAQLRDAHVVAVTAWRPPRPPAAPAGRPPAVQRASADQMFADEQRRLSERVAAVLGADGADGLASLRVEYSLRKGTPAQVLLAAAVGAQLLVLDSPRSGNFSTVPKSWIVPQVLFKSPCPVVLMPALESSGGHRIGQRVAEAAEAVASAGRPGLRL